MDFRRAAASFAATAGFVVAAFAPVAASPSDLLFDVIVHPKPVPKDADLLDTCIHMNLTLGRVAPPLQTPVGVYNSSTTVGNEPPVPHAGLRHACISTFYGVKRGARYFLIVHRGSLSVPFKPIGGWFNPFTLGLHERVDPLTKNPYREVEIGP